MLNSTYYATFAEAFADAQAGDTITMLADAEASEVILINKSLTINGNGHKVTSNATRVFRVTTGDVEVTLNNVNMVSKAVRVGTNDIRGISIDDVNNVKLTLNNCSVDFIDASACDWAYAVNVVGGANHTLTISGGTYEGANVINVRGANSTVTVENTTLTSLYPNNDVYYGACIWVLQNQNSTVEATGNTFNGANAVAFNVGSGNPVTESNNTDNTTMVVAKIGDAYYTTLAAAFAAANDGDEVKILHSGTYNLTTSGKDITITGVVDGVVFDNIGAHNMGGANVTFNNVTFDYYPNVNYTGLQHSGNLVYNNCTINGQVFLYGQSETFNNCTFNQNSADAYNVWTYGAKEVEFNNCTFNSVGKSVLIYAESASVFNDVTVTGCEFVASASVDGKAAIEMDSSLTAGIKLTIDAATTVSNFGTGNVSGNSLWNNKKDNKTEANNDITVVVDGDTVLAPVTFVAQIGTNNYASLSAAIAAAKAGDTITFVADITESVTVSKNVTIDGAGKTFTGQMKLTNKANITIKNVNFDGNGYDGYAVQSNGAYYITIENCTAKNYSYGILQVSSDSLSINVKDVTVSDCRYGIKIDRCSGSVTLENVVLDVTVAGLLNSNYKAKTITIKNSDISILGTWTRNNTTKTTYVFEGANSIDQFDIDPALDNFKLAAGATLTAPQEITVTTDVENHEVKYENGTYKVAEITVAKIGKVEYTTLQKAVDAAKAGQTITLLRSTEGAGVVIDKNLTINFAGYTYTLTEPVGSTGTESNGFQILAGNKVNLKNGTLKVADSAADKFYILIQNYSDLHVSGMTLDGTNLDKWALTDGDSYVVSNNSGKVTIISTNIIANNDGDQAVAFDVCKYGNYALPTVTLSSVTYTGKIEAAAKAAGVYYATLEQAIEKAGSKSITLVGDTSGNGIVFTGKTTIDFNGYTYTFSGDAVGSKGTETLGFQILAGADVDLRNGTLKVADSAASKYAVLVMNYANLGLTNMTLDGTNLDCTSVSYALSTNSGKVNIKSTNPTTIIANDRNGAGDYAFDVYDYSSAGYALPTLVVNSGSKLIAQGKVDAAASTYSGKTIYYATLQQAIDASANGEEITLVSDINVGWDDVTMTSDNLPVLFKVEGKSLTLDMNGKTISVDHQSTTDRIFAVIYVEDGASLTVKGEGGIDVNANADTPKVAYMFWKRGTTGTLTIENGTYHMNNSEDSMVYTNGNRIVTVKGGTWTLDAQGTRENGFPYILNASGNNTQAIIVTGGTYNDDISNQHWIFEVAIEDGKGNLGVIVDNGDGTWTVTGQTAEVGVVEKVIDGYKRLKGYPTLADAVASVKKGQEATETVIMLMKNVTQTGRQYVGKSYVQNIVIDLNGFNLKSNDNALTAYRAGTTLTVKNGTVQGMGDTLTSTYKGTLILGDNLVVACGGSRGDAVRVDNGTLIVKEGTKELYLNGTKLDIEALNNADIQISAGYFKRAVDAEWCAEGYVPTDKLENGYYSVMVDPAYGKVAQIGNSYFETLAEAVEAAVSGDEIVLIDDIELTTANTVLVSDGYAALVAVKEKAITIDLNNKNIVVNANADDLSDEVGSMLMSVFCVDTNGSLTLTGEGSVTVNSNGADVYSLAAVYGKGGKLEINGGTYIADAVTASGSLIYAQYSEVITVNGGTFILGNVDTGANGSPWIFNGKGQNSAHILVNGGTFNDDIQHQYWVFEVQMPKELALSKGEDGMYTTVPAAAYVNDQVWFNAWYTNYVGYATVEEAMAAVDPVRTKVVGKNTYTSAQEYVTVLKGEDGQETVKVETNEVATLDEALRNGSNVTMTESMTVSAKDTAANSGYGATGVKVDGGSFNGNGNTLKVTNANYDTWDCAVNVASGVIQNVTITGAFRGIFMSGTNGDVYVNNVVLDGVTYTIHSDNGNKNYGVYVSNSTLKGWTSFSNSHKEVVFTDCTFGYGGGYAYCRPYNKVTVFTNCVFEEGFKFDTSKVSGIVFENCYYGETLITAENAAQITMFVNGLNGAVIK